MKHHHKIKVKHIPESKIPESLLKRARRLKMPKKKK